MQSNHFKSWVLEIVVFACGALVMAFEIIGSRILSPFLGASTYIWTSLIGIILGSLSIGYWLGGRQADKTPEVRYLAGVLVTASTCVSVTALGKELVLSTIAGLHLMLEFKALIAAVILFAPASICLGFVAPFAARLRVTSTATSGSTVGRLYALSTVGSIAGTFAAGFLLIPFVGSVRTLYLIAASLLALSALMFPMAISRTGISAGVMLIFAIGSTEGNAYLLRIQSDVYDIDTEYSRVQVFRTTEPNSGREMMAIATDPYFVQSAAFLDSDEPALDYGRFYHLIRYFKPDLRKTLIIGGAGYSFPKEYLRAYPKAEIDVVEIDPRMTSIARRFFRLEDDPRMAIFHEDGRMFINRSPNGKYDAVLLDAFGSMFSVPTHLTTIEAVRHLNRILSDDGVLIFNLGSSISGPGSRFLNAELATYGQVFPMVQVFKVKQNYADDRLQNVILVAFKAPSAADQPPSDPFIAEMLGHRYSGNIAITESVVTDDLAPVEYYNSIAQNLYLADR